MSLSMDWLTLQNVVSPGASCGGGQDRNWESIKKTIIIVQLNKDGD